MKKFLSLIIFLNLVLTSLTPVYANNVTGSALRLNTVKAINDTKATTDTNTVSPSSYGVNPYYYNGTSTGLPQNNLGSSTTWSGLITGISYSIAYSIRSLGSVVNTTGNNINTTLSQIYSRLATTNTTLDNIHSSISGLNTNVISIYTRLGDINTSNNSIDSKLTTIGTNVSNILSAIQSLSFTVPQELLDNVETLTNNQVTLSRISPDSSAGWADYWIRNPEWLIRRYRQTSNGGSNTDINRNITLQDPINNIWFWLYTLNDNFVLASRDLTSGIFSNPASPPQWLDKDLNPTVLPRTSLWFDIRTLGVNINNIIARLGFVLANDTDIQARQYSQNQTQATMNDFIKPTGKSSVSTSNLGDLANMSDGLQDAMNTNVSATSTLSVFGDNGNWSWFTQDNANAFDTVSNTNNNRLRSKSNNTPYLDAYYEEVNNALGH